VEAARTQTAQTGVFDRKTVRDIDVRGKRVLVRVDFNVPLGGDGEVAEDTRIREALPTINYLRDEGASVILVTHLGRPQGVEDRFRLDPVGRRLAALLGAQVIKLDETVTEKVTAATRALAPGGVILLENVRFNAGEKEDDPAFARKLSDLAEVFVNDAFGVCHRGHASVVGVARFLPAVAGLLLEKEILTLNRLITDPARPFVTVLGGNKVSDKIGMISRFLDIVDAVVTGGGMCFTFLRAKGYGVGASLLQEEMVPVCVEMMSKADLHDTPFYLPSDVVIARSMDPEAERKVVGADSIPEGWMGLDIGPETTAQFREVIRDAKTIFWNGPMGVFEMEPFAAGTRGVAEEIAACRGTTIVGGGDTDAALRHFGVEEEVSFVSTGGGASLKLLEGTPLPGVEALLPA